MILNGRSNANEGVRITSSSPGGMPFVILKIAL